MRSVANGKTVLAPIGARSPGFKIYWVRNTNILRWLARKKKAVFGTLGVAGPVGFNLFV